MVRIVWRMTMPPSSSIRNLSVRFEWRSQGLMPAIAASMAIRRRSCYPRHFVSGSVG